MDAANGIRLSISNFDISAALAAMTIAGFRSDPITLNPRFNAVLVVVPLPFHGSNTTDLGERLIVSSMLSTNEPENPA
ncbi:hypothetical protein D3C84_852760 [compost metagenome]